MSVAAKVDTNHNRFLDGAWLNRTNQAKTKEDCGEWSKQKLPVEISLREQLLGLWQHQVLAQAS